VPSGAQTLTNGDILIPITGGSSEPLLGLGATLGRLAPTSNGLVLLDSSEDRPFPYAPGFEVAPQAGIVASPDGRAVAIEDGDLGVAGCGAPWVLLTEGGSRRPFPVGAFELVSDLAWAPDSSALYAVRRPTVDQTSEPFADRSGSGESVLGPGTILRWDTATGEVTELGSPCARCPLGSPFVSPDGSRVAITTGPGRDGDWGDVAVLHPDGAWQTVAQGRRLLGWADSDAIVASDLFEDIGVIALDGAVRAAWPDPCCHGTGYGDYSLLSPDGTRLAGMTLARDMVSWNVTTVDLRDGSARDVWGSVGGGMRRPPPDQPPVPPEAFSGSGRVVGWSPDGTAVLVLEHRESQLDSRVWIVEVDGSGASSSDWIAVADTSSVAGLPFDGPGVAWMSERS
jgi:hypothetical protein